MPDSGAVTEIFEPFISANILCPSEYVGAVITLCIEKRGVQKEISYHGRQVAVEFDLPLAEVVLDFHDKLKSISKGYASFDYEILDYRPGSLEKVSILVNGENVESLSFRIFCWLGLGRKQ